MSKALVDWARENPGSVRRAYALLVSFGLDHQLVEQKLVPRAAMMAHGDFRTRRRGRALAVKQGRTPWTSCPSAAQTLQLAVFRTLREADEEQRDAPGWYLVRYLTSLVAYTSAKSAFYVATAVGGILSNGRTRDILELYDAIAPKSGTKSERQVRRVRKEVSKHLGATLGHLIATDLDGVPVTTLRPKTVDDEFHDVLAATTPWDTTHVPDRRSEYGRLIEGHVGPEADPSWDTIATHLLLDQRRCFGLVTRWSPRLAGKFDHWRLPRPHPPLLETAGFLPRPPAERRPPDDGELLAWIAIESSSLGL